MPDSLFSLRSVARDVAALLALAVLAASVGLTLNAARAKSLPWRYASAQARLELALRHAAPSGGLARAAFAAKPRVVDLEEFQQLVAGRSGLILDGRAGSFYRLGHVPGALNLSRETFDQDYSILSTRLADGKDKPVAVYCSGADCADSRLVAEALAKLGFRNVLVYPEGWEQWTEAGLPAEPSVPSHT